MKEDHEEILSAVNAEDLSKCLVSIDVSAIEKSRKTEYIQVCRLLSTVADTDYLHYPLSLKKQERPDFLMNCNGTDIGIEATVATHPDYKEYESHAKSNPSEAEKSSHVIAVPSIRHGTKLTKKNDYHERNELDDGWAGNAPEQDWFLYIKDSIANKCKKLAENSFQEFSQNWLLIYADLPAFFLEKEELNTYIEQLWPTEYSLCFDRIFIESCWSKKGSSEYKSWFIALSRDEKEFFPVENIWRKAS